jgi:hypothetical protein
LFTNAWGDPSPLIRLTRVRVAVVEPIWRYPVR